MHIIFGNISYWQIPIMKILRYLKFEVFYLYIEYKSDLKKKEINGIIVSSDDERILKITRKLRI